MAVACFAVSAPAYGQLNNIQYKNEFEKKILSNLENSSDLEVLVAISENGSIELLNEINAVIEEMKLSLQKKKFHAKSEEKKLKLLFDLTHKNYLFKYREISNFDQIFSNNEYNCVSATALFCLLLKNFDIPFSIKETPTHVYSIAYPTTKNIVLESTAPEDGYYVPTKSEIQKAVTSLVELKYFTEEEVEILGVNKIYQNFFFSEDEIDLRKLAGLQYYNEAVQFLSESDPENALNSSYKSQLLYPSERTTYMSYLLLSNLLGNAKFKDIKDIMYLTQYANLEMADKDNILIVYERIVNDLLFFNNQAEKINDYFKYLQNNLSDTILKNEIAEIHYSGFAQYHVKKFDNKKSLEFSLKAYNLNPNNVTIQSLITFNLVQDLEKRIGNAEVTRQMDRYLTEFDFLHGNSLFQSLYFFNFSKLAYNHFRADDIKSGFEYLNKMESVIENVGEELKYDEYYHGLVYAEAGAAYFRKRKYIDARKIIEKGLAIMPDHPELKVRLEIVNDELR